MFRGKVQDCFDMPGKGLVLMMSEIEGVPQIGTLVDFLGGHRRIVDIGRAAAQGSIILEWSEGTPVPTDIGGVTVQEIKLI